MKNTNWFFDSLANIPEGLASFWDEMVEMINATMDALYDFYNMLMEFDETIVAMTDSCGSSEFVGMPVVDSIAMFHYLVGDVAFMMIYFTIFVGCLFTIYKLIVLIYDGFDNITQSITGASSKNFFYNMIMKFVK